MALTTRGNHILRYSSSIAALCVAQGSYANPQGGQVVGGSAEIKSPHAQKLEIHQHTDKAVIDWRSFDIGVGEHTEFKQPSKTSHTLNRVVGLGAGHEGKASEILGKLSANGKVTLVNQNGVFFGKNAQVDVNGLIATTADIDNKAFMQSKGKLDFNKASPNPNAAIVNHGTITAKEAGLVGLVAPHVENHGVIQAKLGSVHLASGDTVGIDLGGHGLYNLKISDSLKQQLVLNTGSIQADGGTINITAAAAKNIVNSLVQIEGELNAPTVEQSNGKIIIRNQAKGGKTVVSGKVTAANNQSVAKMEPAITVLGEEITISGQITADGKTGGGTILIGGDYQGGKNANIQFSNVPLPPAQTVKITKTASITANAIESGDGGNVVVWADGHTSFKGTLEAKGGIQAGDGGFAEVSGKQTLDFADGIYDLTAINGKVGHILFDPATFTFNEGDLEGISGNSTFQADSLITINDNTNDDIFSIGAYDVTFEILVGGNITMADTNDTIRTQGGDLTFIAYGGNLSLGSLDTTNNGGTAAGGNITLIADELSNIVGLNAGTGGTITIKPHSSNIDINLGTATGGLNLTQSMLDAVTSANKLIIGDTINTGLLTISSIIDLSTPAFAVDLIADSFNFASVLTLDTNKDLSLTADTGGITYTMGVTTARNITINAAGGVGSAANHLGLIADSVILTAGGNSFIAEYDDGLDFSGTVTNNGTLDVRSAGVLNINSANFTNAALFASLDTLTVQNSDIVVSSGTGNISFVSASDIRFLTSVQHQDAGAINIVAGWDGTTEAASTAATANVANILAAPSSYGNDNDGAGSNTGSIFVNKAAGNADQAVEISSRDGDVTLAGYNLNIQAGDNSNEYSKVGYSSGAATGNIRIDLKNQANIYGGTSTAAWAQIGHGLKDDSASRSGNIIINAASLNLASSTSATTYAQIGHGGQNSDGIHGGDITITLTGDASIAGGTGNDAYAMIGHGGRIHDGDVSGTIAVTAQNIRLDGRGGSSDDGFVQIGHGGHEADGDFSGGINIDTGNLTLISGTTSEDYALVGHGGRPNAPGTGSRQGNIIINASGEISLVSVADDWYIGHVTNSSGTVSNANIRIMAGSLDFDDDVVDSSVFEINESDFRIVMEDNLDGGDVTLLSTSADLSWDRDLSSNSTNTFTLASVGNLNVIGEVITDGVIAVFAGWDSTTGLGNTDGTFNLSAARLTAAGAGKDLFIDDEDYLASDATGTAIIAATANNFLNSRGASAISTPNGRWVLYVDDNYDNADITSIQSQGSIYSPLSYGDDISAYSGNYTFYKETITNAVIDLDTLIATGNGTNSSGLFDYGSLTTIELIDSNTGNTNTTINENISIISGGTISYITPSATTLYTSGNNVSFQAVGAINLTNLTIDTTAGSTPTGADIYLANDVLGNVTGGVYNAGTAGIFSLGQNSDLTYDLADFGTTVGKTFNGYTITSNSLGIHTTAGDLLLSGTGATGGTSAVFHADEDLLDSGNISFDSDVDGSSIILRADRYIHLDGSDSQLTSSVGISDITLNSDRDNDGAGGIVIDGTDISSGGGDIVLGGGLNPITTTAKGSDTLDIAHENGVDIDNAIFNAAGGDITFNGQGLDGSTSAFVGINLNDNTTFTTSGTGNITMTGIAGNSASGNEWGILLEGTTLQNTGSGNITLTGTGQNGDSGIEINSGTTTIGHANMAGDVIFRANRFNAPNLNVITNTTSGRVIYKALNDGTTLGVNASSQTASYNNANTLDVITATSKVIYGDLNSGAVTIAPSWGLSSYGFEVEVQGDTISAGTITTGGSNLGLYTTGTANVGSDITYTSIDMGTTGILSIGETGNRSLNVANIDSIYSTFTNISNAASVQIAATGDMGLSGTGNISQDIYLYAQGDLDHNSDTILDSIVDGADMTFRANRNIVFNDNGSSIDSSVGTSALTFNSDRDGVNGGAIFINDVSISSNGGDIIMGGGLNPLTTAAIGVNGLGTTLDSGITFQGSDEINAKGGNIYIRGQGADNAISYAVGVNVDSTVRTWTDGTIDITGTGGNSPGQDAYGIRIDNGANIRTTSDPVTLSGIGQNGSVDIYASGNGDISGEPVIFNADTIDLTNFGSISTSTSDGRIFFTPRTAGTAINIGTGTGGLDLTLAELSIISSNNHVIVGALVTGTGLVSIGNGGFDLSAQNLDLSVAGGNIVTGGNITMGSNSLLLFSGVDGSTRNLTIDHSISSSSGNNSLMFLASGNVTINAAINNTGGTITAIAGFDYSTGLLSNAATGKDLIFGASGSLTSTATGDAIIAATANNLTNNRGASALAAASGRWLLYVDDDADNTNLTSLLSQGSIASPLTYGDDISSYSSGNYTFFNQTISAIDIDLDLLTATGNGSGAGVFNYSGITALNLIDSNTSNTNTTVNENLSIISGGTITYTTPGATTLYTSGNSVTFTAAGAIDLSGLTIDTTASSSTAGANINITADSLAMATGLNAGTGGIVTLKPYSSSRNINLGTATGGLDLTQGELDAITSANKVIIGDATNTGNINVSSAIDLTSPAFDVELLGDSIALNADLTLSASKNLTLTADADAINRTDGVITANNIVANGATGIGSAGNRLLASGASLTATTGGNSYFTNSGALELKASTITGLLDVFTGGALTVSGAVSAATAVFNSNTELYDFILGAGGSVATTGTGEALVIRAKDFINNNSSTSALNATGGGRYAVYTNRSSENTTGNLLIADGGSGQQQHGISYGDTISGFSGNYFFYTLADGTIRLIPIDQTYTYNGSSQFSTAYTGGYTIHASDVSTITGAGYTASDFISSLSAGPGLNIDGTVYTSVNTTDAFTPAKDITLTGSLTSALGYTVSLDNGTAGAYLINPKAISAITGITASNKIYDATTAATLSSGSASFTGMVGGDTLAVATSTGAFNNANVGTNKIVSVTGLTLGGADAGNYTLSNTTASTTADITARALTVTANAGQTKEYGDADPGSYTYTLSSGVLQGADSFTGALNRDAGENVGAYAINQNTLTVS